MYIHNISRKYRAHIEFNLHLASNDFIILVPRRASEYFGFREILALDSARRQVSFRLEAREGVEQLEPGGFNGEFRQKKQTHLSKDRYKMPE